MLQVISDNIFNLKVDYIVNPVNCVGVMGAGLAAKFKKRYPSNFETYKSYCDDHRLSPGGYFINQSTTPKIINFATKNHWRDPSRLEWIEQGIFSLAKELGGKENITIAFPLLGAGLGGLPPNLVHDVMIRHLKEFKCDVVLVSFKDEVRFNGQIREKKAV